ncbi:DEAD/DEAH box helicase [Streptomyces sp. NBC_01775]|uniref:DEAD/DEAH box helicase n=1 Tax=Streptomyces sp. NBC_01775 TaxID=2975939 RepID=UPI002DDA45F2|nr:DEAD/DEAH box helicase [Streptomyces sp. NBC_01775]WSB75794.1 DEAD/DEAH box helicase [Streptomyces sp. NBC_01775]
MAHGEVGEVSGAARKIAEIVRAQHGGLDPAALHREAVRLFPRLPAPRLERLLAECVEGGLLALGNGRYRPPEAVTASPPHPRGEGGEHLAVRAIALDLESVVRTVPSAPYVERYVYEVAAVRFGTDPEWIADEPRWEYYLRFPHDQEELRDARVRAAVRERGVEESGAAGVWAGLAARVADADLVVAYNGTALDFPVIREAAQRAGAGDPLADVPLVDGLYLAHCLWPTAPAHRMHALARELDIPAAGLHDHRAADDATLLAALLERASRELVASGEDLAGLIADVCPDSQGWGLLRRMAPIGRSAVREPRGWEQSEVGALLGDRLGGRTPRRATGERPSGRAALHIPGGLTGANGRVDPTALARVVHGPHVEPRPAQQEMAATLHTWTDQGVSGLLEAPTGTGKSYAILAAALDWLAGGEDRTAVIATYTKQLQSQLARDLRDVERALPGLLGVADLVKGQSNRLSLAALTHALADATRYVGPTGPTVHDRARPTADSRFRELLVYLTLRLLAAEGAPYTWTARSVDPVDVPAFFTAYTGRSLPRWLEALSQRDGDFGPGAHSPLAVHTDTVREALAAHRLVLANHALALTHLDDMAALGPGTLVLLDEAHELENAATSALTVAVDHQDLETLLADYAAWCASAHSGPEQQRAATAIGEFERLLDDERLPRLAAQVFDAHAKGVGVRIGSRTATLASPYTGTGGGRTARRLSVLLAKISAAATGCRIALERHAAQYAEGLDRLVRERLDALAARTDTLTTALDRVCADTDAFLDPAPTLDGTSLSRVVHLEELAEPVGEMRAYRFRIADSPLELPADPDWRRFLKAFDRVHYISATLRVAGRWDFVRERLGLSAGLPTLALASPFDLRSQAELVCFSDFPSWAEQEEGALRTVAHQLAGYAAEMVRLREDGHGFDGGAMVLTTAWATAAGSGAYLAAELRSREHQAPVHEALTLGNSRAYDDFTDRESGGGFLVGTRGLWQGVDVSDQERLRLVWINKLPFAPFAAPLVEARRAAVRERAEQAGHPDPDAAATERYYLPLAALQLRQAVGRLIRSERHRGVIIISDRKLAGHSALRRSYRRAFLGSLDDGLVRSDPDTREAHAGNVVTMAEGWRRIWEFLAARALIEPARAAELVAPGALAEHTVLPQTRRIRELTLTPADVTSLRAAGRLVQEVGERCARVGGLLKLSEAPVSLKPAQRAVITAVAEGRDVLGLLPTGFGKSFTFQLPALVLPGVTLVVSPLVALMHDQALELNQSIGGAVRALISPLRESSSRAGKTEVAEQLLGRQDHGIRLLYVSPERLCQRRFQGLVREATATGRLTRIAFDEAHTIAQWEDFRPSMRRAARFVGELREEHGVGVTAVTATANRTVHEALREGLFGLPAAVPQPGSAEEKAEAAREEGSLITVRENPIRPELAVFRRSLNQLGQGGAAGLVERVVDALEGHAILYCLTVKEVNTLYTHLREYVGDGATRVLRFHGRLTEAEKTAAMSEFREAPRAGEDGFAPVVTVATSAFGLGVNRSDVRTVFCVSPPTDLAALYQQIGRAGRDSAGTSTLDEGPVNSALALVTGKGLRTVRFMTGQELAPSLLRRMGALVLTREGGTLDPVPLAELLMNQDAADGTLTEAECEDRHTQERYQGGVMRAFSALADLGAVTDRGDHPPYCAVAPGELGPDATDERAAGWLTRAELLLIASALSWDTPRRLDVRRFDEHLAATCPDYREIADGPAGTWELLADLHDRGLLDVSAAPSRRFVTGLTVRTRQLPNGYLALLTRGSARAAAELAALRHFFEAPTVCAQRLFADYFGVTELPDGCCTTERCRCSACWDSGQWPVEERRPAVARAFQSARPRDGGDSDSAQRAHRVDLQVYRLLQLQPQGMHPRRLWHALRGDESAYLPTSHKVVALPRAVRDSRHFGGRADLPWAEVGQSLQRLAGVGAAVETEHGRWRAVRVVRSTTSVTNEQQKRGGRA